MASVELWPLNSTAGAANGAPFKGIPSLRHSPGFLAGNLGPSGNAGDIALNGHGFVHVDFDVAAFELIETLTELPALLGLIEVLRRDKAGDRTP